MGAVAEPEPRRPVLIVVHYTEQDSVGAEPAHAADAQLGRSGQRALPDRARRALYQLVADDRRAWHAGAGSWGTITDVNSASIGIELDNDGGAAFPPAQVEALLRLMDDLCTRLDIPRHQVICARRHGADAQARSRCAVPVAHAGGRGLRPWPAADAPPAPAGFDTWLALRPLGYSIDDPGAALRAYRLHYRGDAGLVCSTPKTRASCMR